MRTPHTTTNPTTTPVASEDVFEVQNAACPRCDSPLWYDRKKKDFLCPQCRKTPVPVALPIDRPAPKARRRVSFVPTPPQGA